jgi:hypothetical protein
VANYSTQNFRIVAGREAQRLPVQARLRIDAVGLLSRMRISHSGHTAGGLIRLSATFGIANATFSLQREISLHAQRFQKPALAQWPAGSAEYYALARNSAEPGLCAPVGEASGKLRVAAAVAQTLHSANWNFH